MPAVLVDAGPLVALMNRGDTHHEACRRAFKAIDDPLATVWPALTEAMYVLRASPEAQHALWQFVETTEIQFADLGVDDLPHMRELMWKYRDLPMDLADAALVRVAQRDGLRRIFTVDRRDFAVYRPSRSGRFAIIP